MKSLRFYLAMAAAKGALFGLRLLRRNGTSLPGDVAVKIDKNFLAELTPPETVIAVTGTNGKTTVSNLLTSILRGAGHSVTNNSLGTNIRAGVVTALLADSTFSGRPKKDIAVLEVDERSSLLIYPYLKPDYLICNNLMRDSIKRNAHTEFIRYIIDSALPESTKLILNADDLICALLAPKNESRTYFGITADIPTTFAQDNTVKDIVYCPNCGGKLVADYIRYNHIGRMHCEKCGMGNPEPDFVVTAIDSAGGVFTVSHGGEAREFRLISDNIVNVYNSCGVIALLSTMGMSFEDIARGFSSAAIVKSRLGEVEVCGRKITVMMAKGQNPIACSRCVSYAASVPVRDKRVIIMEDDKHDNTNNVENTCWIYDCDYSPLKDDSITHVLFVGPRCLDQYLHALMDGVPEEKMSCTPDYHDIPEVLETRGCSNFYFLHDLYYERESEEVTRALTEKLREEGAV